MTFRTLCAFFTLLLLASLSLPARAYLDPGTGSAILQGVLGALAAIAVVAKLYWHRLLVLLGVRKPTRKPQSSRSARDTETAEKNGQVPRDSDAP